MTAPHRRPRGRTAALACAAGVALAVGGCAGGVPEFGRAVGAATGTPPVVIPVTATVTAVPVRPWRRTAASRNDATATPRWEPVGAVDPADVVSAGILSVRRGDADAGTADGLADAVDDDTLPAGVRAAAAEAWVAVLAAETPPDESLAPAGRLLGDETVPDAVRAELLRSLSSHLAPARFAAADGWGATGSFGTPAALELRRAVVEAAVLHASTRPGVPESHLPGPLRDAAFDPDPGVRRLVCRYLATAAPPDAVDRLVDRLADAEPAVRREAVAALGVLHRSPRHAARAREELRLAAESGGEPLREAVAAASAGWGAGELRRFRTDESAAVRAAAARSLADARPPERAVAVLSEFLADDVPAVQAAAVGAVGDLADRFALPLLLTALRDAALPARRAALAEVRRRTGRRDPFPLAEGTVARTAAVNRWAAELAAPVGPPPAWFGGSGGGAVAAAEPSEGEGSPGPPAGTAAGSAIPASDLPPVLAASLAGLSADSVHERRAAAAAIAAHAESGPLPVGVGTRVAEHLGAETDRTVWHTLAALPLPAGDADAVTLAALHHGSADVRRLGCERASGVASGGVGVPRTEWVLPLLADPEATVRVRAADAVGAAGHPAGLTGLGPDRPGLSVLADDPDPAVRAAGLDARARLGDSDAIAALARGFTADSPTERVEALGRASRTGRAELTPHLLRLAWTERDAAVREALLAALERCGTAADRPPPSAAADSDRLGAWVEHSVRRGGMTHAGGGGTLGGERAPTR